VAKGGAEEHAARRDGRGGIRTPEAGVTRLLVFKTSAFNRSATLPSAEIKEG
jgi:hypothetical protein